jgi:hypothetical protein
MADSASIASMPDSFGEEEYVRYESYEGILKGRMVLV